MTPFAENGPGGFSRNGSPLRDLEAFVERHLPRWHRIAAGVLRDAHWVEDAVNEALAALLEQLRADNEPDDPEAWMATVVKNAALNRRRNEAKWEQLRRHAPRIREVEQAVEHDAPLAEDLFVFASELLGRLPPQQKRILTRRLLQGRSHAEIAQELGCLEATVRSLARTGMDRLHEIVKRSDILRPRPTPKDDSLPE